jgi:uncharacterized RDD family membrane protein YckC
MKDHAPPPASLVRRVLASVLDFVILLSIIFLPAGAAGVALAINGRSADSPAVTWFISLAAVCAAGLYSTWTMAGEGQSTWGQRALGLRNYHLEDGRLDVSTALGRYVVSMLSSFFMLGYLTAFFSVRRQTLHDRLMNTVVIDAKTHERLMVIREQQDAPASAQAEPR